MGESIFQTPLTVGFSQAGDQGGGGGEQDGIPLVDRGPPQRDGEMGFPDPGRPQQEDPIPIPDPAAERQFPEVFGVEGRLRGEIEVLQSPNEGELRQTSRHLQAPLFPVRDFGLTEEGQRLAQVQIPPGGLIEESVQLIAQRG